MSVIRDLARERAKDAYECAEKALRAGEINDYAQQVKKIPAMIRTSGFAKTMAFYYAKSGIHERVAGDIQKWLEKKGVVKSNSALDQFVKELLAIPQEQYRNAVKETLAFLDWLRRFADGMASDSAAPQEKTD